MYIPTPEGITLNGVVLDNETIAKLLNETQQDARYLNCHYPGNEMAVERAVDRIKERFL